MFIFCLFATEDLTTKTLRESTGEGKKKEIIADISMSDVGSARDTGPTNVRTIELPATLSERAHWRR